MKKRIKRVSKGYWLLAGLWLVSVIGRTPDLLTVVTGVVMVSYLCYTMAGDSRG